MAATCIRMYCKFDAQTENESESEIFYSIENIGMTNKTVFRFYIKLGFMWVLLQHQHACECANQIF